MGEKIVVGPVNKGLRNDVTPFNIDNDSFPVLTNAYQWRGRIKRKRGTSLLGRLQRFFNNTAPYTSLGSIPLVGGAANIITGFSLGNNSSLVPGTVTILDLNTVELYNDSAMDGTLSGNMGGSGTINYATGAITIVGGGGDLIAVTINYNPNLPVMGLEDLTLGINQFPGTLAFDTTYSYNIKTTAPYDIYDVSFYKNPATGTYPAYVHKDTIHVTPTSWNGQDYQQFWTVNYQGALWATNGINQPFSITNIGMQYKFITGITIVTAGNGTTIPAVADITIVAHGLEQGDFIFVNEVLGITGINLQTGYVTSADPQNANLVRVTFPYAILAGAYASGGIAQYLTNRSDVTKDCLRWYDGDPTNGGTTVVILNGINGWVNFAPPLNDINLFPDFSIADLPPAQYYLVGAKMIVPFKDRLLFIGPVVQTSAAGSQEYLQDTVIYSQNGTPYYTASFNGDPTLSTTFFNPILVPDDQTASPIAYYEDLTGFGGFQTAGVDQPINTVSSNEDVLILGFDKLQTRFVYSGNDITPFNFFIINSELGSGSTFSSINMDEGVITRGTRGWIITSQVETKRVDLSIPDEVFRISLKNNGSERFTAQRDFINEWAYFTFPSNLIDYKFPNMTLQYNYRDNSWARFFECYTTYGQFKPSTGYTWATIGTKFATWGDWDEPWNAGSSTLFQPKVIAGNQQGFILFREEGTGEGDSLYIQNIVGATVTSPDHCLNNGDYIIINGALGTVSSAINGKIFSVANASTNSFDLNPPPASGTYIGGGVIKRMYVPFIQTKQFPVAWGMSRKVRLGVQQYLFSATDLGQVTLLIFLSQNAASPYNDDTIDLNSGLIYSTLLYTCTESSNLGLTPANTNLQMFSVINSSGTNASSPQSQIWHRMNTSLIGDTVQIGITLNDTQMRDTDFKSQFEEIELHGFILDVTPSQVLV